MLLLQPEVDAEKHRAAPAVTAARLVLETAKAARDAAATYEEKKAHAASPSRLPTYPARGTRRQWSPKLLFL